MTASDTHFAPPERDDDAAMVEQRARLEECQWARVVADTTPALLLVLNERRQILYCNQQVGACAIDDDADGRLLGRRPGELLGCIHSAAMPAGCGTSIACRYCGAVGAILEAQADNRPTHRRCRLTNRRGQHLDLDVDVTPFAHAGMPLFAVSLVDVASADRRRALERIFFHDFSNTLCALGGYVELLQEPCDDETGQHYLQAIRKATRVLSEQIHAQRCLLQAEEGLLQVRHRVIDCAGLITALLDLAAIQPSGRLHRIDVTWPARPVQLTSDPALLHRVLDNMLKNALEATRPEEPVKLRWHQDPDGGVTFQVHNPGLMPESVCQQLFQRNFSTKGAGRGLGTYSMKLLGEHYLGGRVTYRSTSEDGTTFALHLPPSPAKPASIRPAPGEHRPVFEHPS